MYRAQQILVQKTNTLLTPENVQIHSQGAALLLVWAANIIKNYAAFKYLGDDLQLHKPTYSNLQPAYKKRDLQSITIQTKLQLREQRRGKKEEYDKLHQKKTDSDEEEQEGDDEDQDEEEMERRRLAKEEKQKKEKWIAKEKVGVVGHFLQNKAMVFNNDANHLVPEKDSQQPKKLIDLNVVKKGANYTSKKSKANQR